jgi:hypothetical protein
MSDTRDTPVLVAKHRRMLDNLILRGSAGWHPKANGGEPDAIRAALATIDRLTATVREWQDTAWAEQRRAEAAEEGWDGLLAVAREYLADAERWGIDGPGVRKAREVIARVEATAAAGGSP